MPAPEIPPSPGRLTALPGAAQWAILIIMSALFATAFEIVGLPAALLIGPMLAAVIFGVNGATIRTPRPAFNASQAIIGCLIAGSIKLEIFASFVEDWPVILLATLATVAASSFLGWSVSRLKILPGTTAVWGTAPGASTAMVLMAAAFGADARLVAFMQYLRVIMVTLAAALVSGLWVDTSNVEIPPVIWFPDMDWTVFLATLTVTAAGGMIGRLVRLPSPYFLGALIVGVAFHLTGLVEFQIPPWFTAVSYAVVGATVGLNFDRYILAHAARALPQIMTSVLVLMAFCGVIAWLLSHELGIDPLTAYLATSPGGMDSVAIIAAASSNVNLSLVMAMQMARFLFVLLFGPAIARLIARSIGP